MVGDDRSSYQQRKEPYSEANGEQRDAEEQRRHQQQQEPVAGEKRKEEKEVAEKGERKGREDRKGGEVGCCGQ